MQRQHQWPIIKVALAATGSFLAVTLLHLDALSAATLSLGLLGWVFLGALYTQFVEYWWHRVPMHRRVKLLELTRLSHIQHHRMFHGKSFQVKDAALLEHIPGRYWAFPLLFLLHYAVLVWILAPAACLAFLLGAVLHYLAFEMSHWLTHIEDNVVDRVITRLPWLGAIRLRQIEHHRIHHEVLEYAFNFNPPYLGDRLAGRMPPTEEPVAAAPLVEASERVSPVKVAPVSVVEAHWARLWQKPLIRYGSVAAASVALLGAVVLAHGFWAHHKDIAHSEQIS